MGEDRSTYLTVRITEKVSELYHPLLGGEKPTKHQCRVTQVLLAVPGNNPPKVGGFEEVERLMRHPIPEC